MKGTDCAKLKKDIETMNEEIKKLKDKGKIELPILNIGYATFTRTGIILQYLT